MGSGGKSRHFLKWFDQSSSYKAPPCIIKTSSSACVNAAKDPKRRNETNVCAQTCLLKWNKLRKKRWWEITKNRREGFMLVKHLYTWLYPLLLPLSFLFPHPFSPPFASDYINGLRSIFVFWSHLCLNGSWRRDKLDPSFKDLPSLPPLPPFFLFLHPSVLNLLWARKELKSISILLSGCDVCECEPEALSSG